MPVDFSLLQPVRSPAPEMASIGNLLSAFAEQRMRQQQAQQQAEFQQRQFEAQQANIAADNARADQQLSLQQKEADQRQQAMQAKQADEERQAATKALPDIMAMAGDRPQEAQARAAGYGIGLKQQPVDMIDETNDVLADRVTPPKFDISIPHSPGVLSYDTGEQQRAQIAATDREKKRVDAAIAPLAGVIPYSGRVAPIAQAYAAIGAKPDEAIKAGIGSAQFAEAQAGSDRRAAQSQRKIEDTGARAEQRINQTALRGVKKDINDFVKETGLQELTKAYGEAGKALTLSKSASGPAQVAAVDAFIKSARGGSVTGQSFNATTSHLGGLLANLESAATAAKQGGYGAEVMGNLARSLQEVRQAIKDEVEPKRQSFVDKYYGSGEYDDVKGNVDNAYTGLFSGFGYKTDRHPGTTGIAPTGKTFTTGGDASGPKRKSPDDWVKEYSR